jgi:hypothetical protein
VRGGGWGGVLAVGLWGWLARLGLSMEVAGGPTLGRKSSMLAWLFLAPAVLGLLVRAHQAEPGRTDEKPLPWRREAGWLAGILVVGALLRFTQLGTVPDGQWYDEVNLSRATQDHVVLGGQAPLYLGEQVENPGAYLWVGGAVFKVFGAGVNQYRALAAFFGLLALVPFWALARIWFGGRWALVATLLYSVLRWTLIPQRIAFMSGFALFWMLAAFWALWAAQLRGGAWRWLLAGLLLGANLHTYTPARFVPLIAAAFLGLQALLEPVWRRQWKGWLWLGLGFLLTAGPMLWYIQAHWADYAMRSQQVSIFADAARSGQPLLSELWTSFSKHLLMFNFRGDFNGRHNLHFYPHADFLMACALAVALPYALGRAFKDTRGRFMALWFGAMLAAGIFTMAVEAPQGHRTILAAPVLALAVAWAVRDLLAPLGGLFAKGWPKAGLAAGFTLLAGVVLLNAWDLFAVWGPHTETWRSFSPRATAAARRAALAGPDVEVHVSSLASEYQFNGYEWGQFTRFALQQQGKRPYPLRLGQESPSELAPRPRALLLIWGESDRAFTEAFQKQFPALKLEQYPNPHPVNGEPSLLYLAAEVPLDAITANGPLLTPRP